MTENVPKGISKKDINHKLDQEFLRRLQVNFIVEGFKETQALVQKAQEKKDSNLKNNKANS
ncbi:hypothetical protein A2422_02880 [Candidatus Woesebacteria bacterium RIFOXYC1_FULL_31_51]|uniref:Uncharacterized protein n=1 Tax=Candidatus Woesebacteria bacterium GW2011_GWC2_31_9 TaxID=1618586 RepID=A0A0G0AWC3_9BACT|nr:MAG: hypothetical protein UR17_C0001G0081 [Candidatus Woesebacteria bacterium GW2011_GWF1_31_35]KKP23422.1 MAG: hypothetical protein UR11_C0001G0396 [Candidatus Woesebacteria bacterium GW2011_GWC1_30_29]KKP26399.1 MAG: hypothetical protein UR13_C0004G0013 [Candidatus Woesebacteria bacterium GW2011_GWD1_31_12]KKP27698.1 MAG: hypothetical protein UR16_C0002G0028 [Candidatus Woesebacteria bacterium GW2011_GWB1_31_29]KKP30915.1 MAG: hypothetical protein UR21_C0020G0010 [Candidatus Woesebacteria 